MAYKAPIWEDGKSPAISAENLNNLSQAAEGAQVLCGNSAPTSSTEGAVGQFYLVVVADSDGSYPLYQCVASANGSYVWRDTRRIPDSITSMLGIPAPGTINSALNVLAHVGNLHVWDRTIVLDEGIPAGYELGPVSNGSFVIGGNSSRQDSTWTYGTEISVDDGGNVSLTGDTATVRGYNSYTGELVSTLGILVGKFAKCTDTGTTIGIPENTIVFFPEDAVVTKTTRDSDTVAVINKYQSVEGHKKIPAGTTTDYLTSTDRNAYTDGTVDNTTITYLGQLGEGARIEVGSYVGTGTYGTGKETSIHLPFVASLIIIVGRKIGDNSANKPTLTILTSLLGMTIANGTGSSVAVDSYNLVVDLSTENPNWRATAQQTASVGPHAQANQSGFTYVYHAFSRV